MKKLLLSILLTVSITGVLKAQQDPQYTQFFMNKLNYNPAYAGSEDKICALGVYRSQWLGFGDDKKGLSPTTFVASINAPIGDKFGVGINISRDELGFESTINPMLSLTYRLRFKNDSRLAFGIGAGFMQKGLAGNKLEPLQLDDPKIPNVAVSGSTMDLNAGLYYTMPTLWRFDNFYAGVSATHLNEGEIIYSWDDKTADNGPRLHYYFMTGASYRVSPSLSIDPNLFVKRDPAKLSTDINVMAVYNEKFKGGITYRTEDALSLLLGFKFTPDMQIGYSYDLAISNIISYTSGSHEILFKYCFMPVFKEKPEKQPVPRLTPRFL